MTDLTEARALLAPVTTAITVQAAALIAKMLLRADPPAEAGAPDGGLGLMTDAEYFSALAVLAALDANLARDTARLIVAAHPRMAAHHMLADLAAGTLQTQMQPRAARTAPQTAPPRTPSPAAGAEPSRGKVVRGCFPPPGAHRPFPGNHQ